MINKELVKELYETGLNGREVSKIIGCGSTSVFRILRKLKSNRPNKIRDFILKDRAKKCDDFNVNFLNLLDGLILSDGCIPKPIGVSNSCFYVQNCVNLEWLEIIKSEFDVNNIICNITTEKRKKKKKNISYVFRSFKYDKFYDLRKRWYPDEIKIVPKDIDLSNEIVLKNWLYGDGTIIGNSTLRFCTDDFVLDDVEFLKCKLNDIFNLHFKIIKFGKNKKNVQKYRLSICKRDGFFQFFEYIGECNVNCFDYKWRKKSE